MVVWGSCNGCSLRDGCGGGGFGSSDLLVCLSVTLGFIWGARGGKWVNWG